MNNGRSATPDSPKAYPATEAVFATATPSAASASVSASSPSLALLGLEPFRAAYEYARMKLMDREMMPKGDGHAVVIFPGLAIDGHAVESLRSFCEQLDNVEVEGSHCGLGWNKAAFGIIADRLARPSAQAAY